MSTIICLILSVNIRLIGAHKEKAMCLKHARQTYLGLGSN